VPMFTIQLGKEVPLPWRTYCYYLH
jgi:hypothetical protein